MPQIWYICGQTILGIIFRVEKLSVKDNQAVIAQSFFLIEVTFGIKELPAK